MTERHLRRMNSEKGASLVLIATSMMLLLGMAALAVDLASIRSDLRTSRLASDAAATAGAIQINPVSGSEAEAACETAWEYLLLNLEDEGAVGTPPNCSIFSTACDPTTARKTEPTAGPYSFVITHPVPDNHLLMTGQAINEDIDGAACQRLGVTVERTREYLFARVMGFTSGTPEASSVARIAVKPGEGELVPLLVLEPTRCEALSVKGGGSANAYIVVDSFNDVPGIIAVDSDGSSGPPGCTGSGYTIHANDTPNNWIRALDVPPPDSVPSAILSYALSGASGADPTRAYEDADVASGRIYPRPTSPFTPRRITRAAIDWRYNCHTSYPDYLGIVKVDGCASGDAPHIDNLRDQYLSGDPGFDQWTTCTVTGPLTISGDKWVRCPSGFVVQSGEVIFEGGDLVFDGGIQVKGGKLHINPTPSGDRVVFLRSGDLQKEAHATLEMEQVFVYMHSGRLDLSGGSGGLIWTAPLGGNFEDLALWAEAALKFNIGGQSGNTLEGTFFTPFADPFSVTGTGTQLQTAAQFISRRLEASGQGQVFMVPDPDRSTPLPIRGVLLIR